MSCSTNCFALQKQIKDFNDNKVVFDKCSIGQTTIDQNMLNNDMARQVNIMKAEIDDLQNKLDNLNDLNNGKKTMKDDFVNQYNFQYLQNTCIFIGIIIILICFFKLFNTGVSTSSASAITNPIGDVGKNVTQSLNSAIYK